MARRGVPDERAVDVHHRGGVGGAAGLARVHLRDKPLDFGVDRIGVGELDRGPDCECGDGDERGPGWGPDRHIRVLRGAHIQHPGGARALARGVVLGRAPGAVRGPGGPGPVRDTGLHDRRPFVGPGDTPEEGHEAGPGVRDRVARHLLVLPLPQALAEPRVGASLN